MESQSQVSAAPEDRELRKASKKAAKQARAQKTLQAQQGQQHVANDVGGDAAKKGRKMPASPSSASIQSAQRNRSAAGGGVSDVSIINSGTSATSVDSSGVTNSIWQRSKQHKQLTTSKPMLQYDDAKKVAKHAKQAMLVRTEVQKQVPLFSHLPQYEKETSLSLKVGFTSEEIHPAIIRLGLKISTGVISGSNARCVAMLTAFSAFISDYVTPPQKVLSRDLQQRLKPLIRFIIDCRPQCVSMGNAIRWLKMKISKVPPTLPEIQAKEFLLQEIDNFIRERIQFADELIAGHGCSKIVHGDVIMIYAMSHVVEKIITLAHAKGIKFRIVIVDCRPKLEGQELLRRLVACGISCTYVMINAVSYVMNEVSKVFIGAYACLANGSVIGRAGSAIVAQMANSFRKPFLVACETYKFHERVQLDSICFNELGDPDDLVDLGQEHTILHDWRDTANLKMLNLQYDLTPIQFITLIVTEIGLIPPTSVAVVLREFPQKVEFETIE